MRRSKRTKAISVPLETYLVVTVLLIAIVIFKFTTCIFLQEIELEPKE
jgi:hypothetical protein